MNEAPPIWADPSKNAVTRPRTKCWGCGKAGCVDKHWGNWCFACNVKRLTRLTASFDQISQSLASLPLNAEGGDK